MGSALRSMWSSNQMANHTSPFSVKAGKIPLWTELPYMSLSGKHWAFQTQYLQDKLVITHLFRTLYLRLRWFLFQECVAKLTVSGTSKPLSSIIQRIRVLARILDNIQSDWHNWSRCLRASHLSWHLQIPSQLRRMTSCSCLLQCLDSQLEFPSPTTLLLSTAYS